MKTKLKATLLILLTFTLINCTKSDDQDQLPPATQTGANTFGLIYDGVVFTPKKSTGFSTITQGDPISVYGYYNSNAEHYSYKITAERGENIKNLLYIYISTSFKGNWGIYT